MKIRTLVAGAIVVTGAVAAAAQVGPHGPIRNLPGPTPSTVEVWGNTHDTDGAPLVVVRVQQRATRPDERHHATATLSPAEARAMGEALIAWAEEPGRIEAGTRLVLFSRYMPATAEGRSR